MLIKKLDVDPMYILKTMYIINEIDQQSIDQVPSLRNLPIYFKCKRTRCNEYSMWTRQ